MERKESLTQNLESQNLPRNNSEGNFSALLTEAIQKLKNFSKRCFLKTHTKTQTIKRNLPEPGRNRC